MCPAAFAGHTHWKVAIKDLGRVRVVVCHRSHTAEQIADASPPEPCLVWNAKTFFDAGALGTVDGSGPSAPARPWSATETRKNREVKMIVSIDQSGQDQVSREIDGYAVSRFSIRTCGADHRHC